MLEKTLKKYDEWMLEKTLKKCGEWMLEKILEKCADWMLFTTVTVDYIVLNLTTLNSAPGGNGCIGLELQGKSFRV